jgi:putative tryptophan/tyrosine transport system substrate-binding protein
VRRREFIMLLGGAAAAWPLAARAQQAERMRRIGVLMNLAADDAEGQARLAAFLRGLQQLGWIEGRNAHLDIRWGAGDAERFRRYAAELVALVPDLILAASGSTMPPLLHATRTVPIVFVQVADPVGNGFVASLARPGGNATGFTNIDFSMSAKWLELLKQIAPGATRAAVLRDSTEPTGIGQWGALQSVAPSFTLELTPVGVSDPGEIERAIAGFANLPNGALIVTASAPTAVHRDLIIALATRHRLPAVYAYKYFITSGGLISYGPDTIDPYRRAAGYIDRILKGEKPADLPVQAPTKYELVINLKTAKALGLEIPDGLLARADEVIE